jgi:hypothetical protein
MEPNLVVLAVAVWFVVSLISRAVRKSSTPTRPARRPEQRPSGRTGSLDPTQREGSRIEVMLREFQRVLEEGREIQQGEWHEGEPEARSLEGEVRRYGREDVDQDDQAEEIETRRINAAAARDQARDPGKGRRPNAQVVPEAADHTATPRYTTQQLRDAVVWREILGPPVSERES